MTAILGRILPLINKAIPAGLAIKGLSKIDPRLSTFVQNSVGAGFAAENIVDYLRDRFSPEGDQIEKRRLEQGEQQGTLTPQERNIQAKRSSEGSIGKGIGAAVGLATGLSGLGGQESNDQREILPQNSQAQSPQPPPSPYKIDAMETQSRELEENYNQRRQEQQAQPNAQMAAQNPQMAVQNPIAALSPELHKFLEFEINNGRPALEAVALARIQGFEKIMASLEKKLGARFADIVERIYGGHTSNEMPKQRAGQQQQQQGQGAQALKATMQNILNKLGG